eukprot:5952340-Amphidinium_carterae.2
MMLILLFGTQGMHHLMFHSSCENAGSAMRKLKHGHMFFSLWGGAGGYTLFSRRADIQQMAGKCTSYVKVSVGRIEGAGFAYFR